jgi:DNA-directed RNA polymerase subunit RPC12/RpoP
MLDVRAVYERELKACRQTFEGLEWPLASLSETRFGCPRCGSDLVAQDAPHEKRYGFADCHCRACGERIPPDRALELVLEAHFETESYIAATDGGEQPVQVCSDCGLAAYLLTDERVGCVSCGLALDECARCMTGLTPENVDPDNSNPCSYCGHLLWKDD